MRTTLGDAKAFTAIARVLNISPEDPRFAAYVNEAQMRLLTRGNWWGTTARFQICVTDACLTWPRQIAALEAVWVDGVPLTIRNQWFEYVAPSLGIQGEGSCRTQRACGSARILNLYDRQTSPLFSDIIGENKRVRVYADVNESDARILIQGYDENRNWIRTLDAGEWVDGEWVVMSTTPHDSIKFFSSITSIQKPKTNGTIRLYELTYKTPPDSVVVATAGLEAVNGNYATEDGTNYFNSDATYTLYFQSNQSKWYLKSVGGDTAIYQATDLLGTWSLGDEVSPDDLPAPVVTAIRPQRAIATYDSDETRPEYRRSFIDGVCKKRDGECQFTTVTAIGKLAFIPALKDTDWLIIGNLNAIKFACQAIRKEENNLMQEAALYMNGGKMGETVITGAIGELNAELKHHRGQSVVSPIRMQPREVGGGGVLNMQ